MSRRDMLDICEGNISQNVFPFDEAASYLLNAKSPGTGKMVK